MNTKAILATALLLTSCAQNSRTVADSMQLYSPATLDIPAGTVIRTRLGSYQAQVDERWYSADLYMQRVREAVLK